MRNTLKLLLPILLAVSLGLAFIGCPTNGGSNNNQTPVAEDFVIGGNLVQDVAGSITPVTITPKTGKSTGAITIFYNGSTSLPSAKGRYTVTFNVAASDGWDAANGLFAGTLRIVDPTDTLTINLSDLPRTKNETAFPILYDDFLIAYDFPAEVVNFSKVTINVRYFDSSNVEIPQSDQKAMVTLVYDPAGDLRGPENGPGPNTPLKEFNIGGSHGRVSSVEGAPIDLTRAPRAILFQNANINVKYIEVTEITFHNNLNNFQPPLWGMWTADDSTATLNLTVDDTTEVATIVVGGTAQPNDATDDWGRWKANVAYTYFPVENTSYAYVFEAWTASGESERTIAVDYYSDNEDEIHISVPLTINETRETYTVIGQVISKVFDYNRLAFQCADQLGTFFVRIVSITPNTPAVGKWHSTVDSTTNATLTIVSTASDPDVVAITVAGDPDMDSWKTCAVFSYNAAAGKSYTYVFEAWAQYGPEYRDVNVQYYNGWNIGSEPFIYHSENIYINGNTPQTFTITGETLPTVQGGGRLEFQCANQTGTFYVRMISVTETP